MSQTNTDFSPLRELSPYGSLSWIDHEGPASKQDVITRSDQFGDPIYIDALFERRKLDDSSSNRSVLRIRVPLQSETVRLSKELTTSSTAPDFLSVIPTLIFQQMCVAAENEVFEHGMESVFSLSMDSFIELYQGLAIRIISDSLASNRVDKAVAMETLHQLGLSEHEPTCDTRKDLLLQHLSSEVAMIRYGAMYGLSSMDDPGVIPEIAKAYKQETDPYLKKYMSAALEQLRETLSGA